MGDGSTTNSVCSADMTETLSTTPDNHNVADHLEIPTSIAGQSLSLQRVRLWAFVNAIKILGLKDVV